MSSLTYFTANADMLAVVGAAGTPATVAIRGKVTFTPMIRSGDALLLTTLSPRPGIVSPQPVTAVIGSDGQLGFGGTVGVRLIADTPVLGLSSPLFYTVTFTGLTVNGVAVNGVARDLAPFNFQAPTADVSLNLVTVARAPGQPASGIVNNLIPDHVRLNGSNQIVFSANGIDLPSPLPVEGYDADLADIAALAPADDDVVQRKAGHWTNRSPAQVKTDLTLVKGDVALGNVDNTSDASKPVSAVQQAALDLKENLSNKSTSTSLGASNTLYPTQNAVKSYVDTAVTGVLKDKGVTDCSANPNYPAAVKGDAYIVTVAGKIGGASGKPVDIGDLYFATADNAGGTEGSVGTSWAVLEHNLAGALLAANNLSDLGSASTARTNLGLGNVDNVSEATVLSAAASAAAAASKSADTIVDGTTNKAYTAVEKTKLAGVATGATANSSDAVLEARANHTGTQSADTLTDGTTNKAFLATERTKLTGIAAGATANSSDAVLEARANHTGTQTASTISDFSTAADARITAATSTGTGALVRATSPALTTPTGIVKGDVGLGNVDNTSDASKPVSTAAQTALDLKAPLASPAFTGTPTGITKTHVGLGNVDNTSDATKNAAAVSLTNKDLTSGTNTFPAFTDSGAVAKSLADAKGDLFAATADNTVARLAAGTLGQKLVSNSSATTGLQWVGDTYVDATLYGVSTANSSSANDTALTAAVAALGAGGVINLPGGSVATPAVYSYTGLAFPTSGAIRIHGADARTTTLHNTHASNPSISMTVTGTGVNPFAAGSGIQDLTLDAAAVNTGQSGIYPNGVSSLYVARVNVSGHDIGVKHAVSWSQLYSNLVVLNCTTGLLAPAGANSVPVTLVGCDFRACTVGMELHSMAAMNMFGGTIQGNGTGLIVGAGVGNNFYGVEFEAQTGDDVVLGVVSEANIATNFFGCLFVSFVNRSRSVLHSLQDANFIGCTWNAAGGSTITTAISQSVGAGALTLQHPVFSGTITNRLTRTDGTYSPSSLGATSVSSIGFGGIQWWGAGKASIPQLTTITSSATPAVDVSTSDLVTITAQAADITSMTSGQTGTARNGQRLTYRIVDDGTPRAITWGANFTGPLPATTVASTPLNVVVTYDSVQAKWVFAGALAAANNLSDVASAATARTNLGVLASASNLSDVSNVTTARSNLGAKAPDVQAFTASGTWTKPAGAASVWAFCQGPGGGGGAGARAVAASVPVGGSGGGSGGQAQATFQASALTSTVAVNIPTGGAGAAGQTVDSTIGANGSNPSTNTTFGTFLQATRGLGGNGGGFAAAGTVGAAGSGQVNGGAGGVGSTSGGAGAIGASGGGGAAGGGVSSGGTAAVGGVGGTYPSMSLAGGTAGAIAGGAGGAGNTNGEWGTGGGGGGGHAAGVGGAGGAGTHGSGGAGGGASVNSNASGAGGAGGDGYCIVVTYF